MYGKHLTSHSLLPCVVVCVQDDQALLHEYIKSICDKYIYQLENPCTDGKDNFHYQGYGHLIERRRAGDLQALAISANGSFNGIRISPASTAGIKSLQDYCLKAQSRVRGPWADKRIYIGGDLPSVLFPWQQEIKDRCDAEPDDRTINVVHNPRGGIGKSKFCKYMAFHHQAPCIGWAKSGDVLALVADMPDRPVYLFDLAKSKPQDWAKDDIPAAMEGIKNGLFVNTKYKVKQVIMNSPHVWVFCNDLPNFNSMSMDRWVVWYVSDSRELVRYTSAELKQLSKSRKRDESPIRVDDDQLSVHT